MKTETFFSAIYSISLTFACIFPTIVCVSSKWKASQIVAKKTTILALKCFSDFQDEFYFSFHTNFSMCSCSLKIRE